MAGFLPPISTMTGLGYALAKSLYSWKPTSNEPVNRMPSTPAFSWISAPTVSPGPEHHVEHAVGDAGLAHHLGQQDTRQGRVRAGL